MDKALTRCTKGKKKEKTQITKSRNKIGIFPFSGNKMDYMRAMNNCMPTN